MGLSIFYQLSARGLPEEISQRMSDWRSQLSKELPDCKPSELIVTDDEVSFDLLPGPGTEIARMRLRHEESDGLGVWAGSWDCKTQYAGGSQYGGPANFLDAHRCLITALDLGLALGLVESVSDDGGYWTHRSHERLLQQFNVYQNLIASLATQVRNAGFAVTIAVQDEHAFAQQERCPAAITP